MTAVIGLTAWKLRQHWRGWLAAAALIALSGGAVLAAVAGAFRTDTAYERFLTAAGASDVIVTPAGNGTDGFYAALARLPGVAASAALTGSHVRPDGQAGAAGLHLILDLPHDGKLLRQVDRPKILAGRLPDPAQPAEVAVDQIAAQVLHLHVGSTLGFTIATGPVGRIRPRHLVTKVVGILVTRETVVPVTSIYRVGNCYASPALYRQLRPGYVQFDAAYVRLRPGTSVVGFGVRAQALAGRFPATEGTVYVSQESIGVATIERAIRPQAVTLALFAAALALTALLIVGQVLCRLLVDESADTATLAALGMTRRQFVAASLLRVAAAAAAGAVAAVAVAVAVSPLTPIGPAKLAETQPGVSVNFPVLALGIVAIPVLFLARVALTAWRQSVVRPAVGSLAPATSSARTRPVLANWLANAGLPLSVVTGLRFARDNRTGRAAVPVAGAVLSLAVAVAAVAGAITFGTNLVRLADTPRLYGQDWDVALDLEYETFTPAAFAALTAHVPGIDSVTFGDHLFVGVGNSLVPAIAVAPGRGAVSAPTITAGRAPRSTQEIAVGASVLRSLGAQVGQRVPVKVGTTTHLLHVVGTATFPYFGEGGLTPTDTGEGVETTVSLIAPLVGGTSTGAGYNFALVRFTRDGRQPAEVAAFQRALAPFCAAHPTATCVVTNQRPNSVSNYAAIDATPAVLAGVLAALGLGVLAQFTVSATRRRRRDFAILKVLGTTRGQLASVACWQAATVTAAGLTLGIPVGIGGGRVAYLLFSGQVGLPNEAVVPLPVLWMIPVTLAAAVLIAFPPARSVARVAAATTLRSE
jgi:hypothetical protein